MELNTSSYIKRKKKERKNNVSEKEKSAHFTAINISRSRTSSTRLKNRYVKIPQSVSIHHDRWLIFFSLPFFLSSFFFLNITTKSLSLLSRRCERRRAPSGRNGREERTLERNNWNPFIHSLGRLSGWITGVRFFTRSANVGMNNRNRLIYSQGFRWISEVDLLDKQSDDPRNLLAR